MRRKPISKPFTFEVERYVGVDHLDPIPNGAELILPVLLIVSRTAHQFHTPEMWARTYAFTGCTVISKRYGELDAEKSGLLTESTTIAFREMMCVDIPWTAAIPQGGITTNTNNRSKREEKSQEELDLEKHLRDLKRQRGQLESLRRRQEQDLRRLNRAKRNLKLQFDNEQITKAVFDAEIKKLDKTIADTKAVFVKAGSDIKRLDMRITAAETELKKYRSTKK
jgi:hypothetical protein